MVKAGQSRKGSLGRKSFFLLIRSIILVPDTFRATHGSCIKTDNASLPNPWTPSVFRTRGTSFLIGFFLVQEQS